MASLVRKSERWLFKIVIRRQADEFAIYLFFGVAVKTTPGHLAERMTALYDTRRKCLYALATRMILCGTPRPGEVTPSRVYDSVLRDHRVALVGRTYDASIPFGFRVLFLTRRHGRSFPAPGRRPIPEYPLIEYPATASTVVSSQRPAR